jgi:hypothetical protein
MRILLPAIALVLSTSYAPLVHAYDGEAAQSEDRLICKHRKMTGTRFTTKTCKTAAQWERIAEESRAAANEMINRPIINTERGN